MIGCSPLAPVDLVAVQVSGQPVLVGAVGFVSSVDVDGARRRVEHAAVAVTSLHQGAVRRDHAPRVPGWGSEVTQGSHRGHTEVISYATLSHSVEYSVEYSEFSGLVISEYQTPNKRYLSLRVNLLRWRHLIGSLLNS